MMKVGRKILENGARKGSVTVPPSKSHEHRLLIANFLADRGEAASYRLSEDFADSLKRRDAASPFPDNADIAATKRCLKVLASDDSSPELDCGESGSTLRFLAPVAAALGKHPKYIRRGRLAERPFKDYASLKSGLHELAGDVSSQFVTGLLFALPLLKGDSEIRFTSPLESRGYVDLTLGVIHDAGIVVKETEKGFLVPGNQKYRAQRTAVEGDWSGAAFWFGMNALGSAIEVRGLVEGSAQPDRTVKSLCVKLPTVIDVSQFPDLFPVLAVVAAGTPQITSFTGIARLHLKECDRVAAMQEALERLGVHVQVTGDRFRVTGGTERFKGCEIRTFGDHRIAMAAAVAATRASAPVMIDDAACCAKSYPGFFEAFDSLDWRQGIIQN